jgi:hypothetical protein
MMEVKIECVLSSLDSTVPLISKMALTFAYIADNMNGIIDRAEAYCKLLVNRAFMKPRYEYYNFLKPKEGYVARILMVISEELGVGTPWFPIRRYERKLYYDIRADGFVMHDENERLSYTFKGIIEGLLDEMVEKLKASAPPAPVAPAESQPTSGTLPISPVNFFLTALMTPAIGSDSAKASE